MPIYQPSELRAFLDRLSVKAKKSLSQNFLIDGNILKKIVSTAEVTNDDFIIEIGPGPGALTEMLLETGSEVIAIEKDHIFAKELSRLKGNLEVIHGDIMKTPIEPLLNKKKKSKVIANLPYHLTTPILSKLIPMNKTLSSITVMVQEEYAQRCIANPGSPNYSSLSVFLKFYCTAQYAFKVRRTCFYPSPRVDSAVIILALKPTPKEVSSQKTFFLMTRTAFQQRRKTLKSSLRAIYSPDSVTAALETIRKNPLARPEELSLEEFIQLFGILNPTL